MDSDDVRILKLYLERNEAAIEETYSKYGKYCFSIANNILNDSEAANECVNDAIFKTWSSIPKNYPKEFKAYLGRIVRNAAIDMYKKQNAQKRKEDIFGIALEELKDCVTDETGPDKEYEMHELHKMINNFLETLSQEKRFIFIQRYWYSESIKNIADRCGKNENYVSVTLNRLRKKLRRYLLEEGIEV